MIVQDLHSAPWSHLFLRALSHAGRLPHERPGPRHQQHNPRNILILIMTITTILINNVPKFTSTIHWLKLSGGKVGWKGQIQIDGQNLKWDPNVHFTHYLSKGRVRNQSSAETVKIGLYNYFWKGSFPDNVLKSSYLFTIFGSDSQSKHA